MFTNEMLADFKSSACKLEMERRFHEEEIKKEFLHYNSCITGRIPGKS